MLANGIAGESSHTLRRQIATQPKIDQNQQYFIVPILSRLRRTVFSSVAKMVLKISEWRRRRRSFVTYACYSPTIEHVCSKASLSVIMEFRT